MEVVYQRVGLGRLQGDGGDGSLEDVALAIRHDSEGTDQPGH
jgi:hypothetical protein